MSTEKMTVGQAIVKFLNQQYVDIPLLLFPSDSFATRQPDPVLQQLEVPESLSTP